jgi:hypothetical protein
MGGTLWYTKKSVVSTLLFVGCFPRENHGWVGLSICLIFRVVYAHLWVFRVETVCGLVFTAFGMWV